MSATPNLPPPTQPAAEPRTVMYVGAEGPLVEAALRPLGTAISFSCQQQVADVLMVVARHRVHAVIIDLTRPDDARTLLVAALAAARHPPRIIILGRREDVGAHLRLPGVYCVIAYPLLPAQIRAAVADRRARRRNDEVPREPPAEDVAQPQSPPETAPAADPPSAEFKAPEVAEQQRRWPGFRLYFLAAGRFMSVVSNLYKNAAFVLLASLFAAFCFYAFLIAYFLLSSGWGAPLTLSRGHQLVEKAVADIGELQVNLSLTVQRESEAELAARTAAIARDDAQVLVDQMKGTVSNEIKTRLQQIQTIRKAGARTRKVLKDYVSTKAQADAHARALYNKRLITRESLQATLMGTLESGQRMSGMQSDLDSMDDEISRLTKSIILLEGLQLQLDTGRVSAGETGSADLILLMKEVVDARSGLDQAASQLASAEERARLLKDSEAIMRQRLGEIENSALGRAIKSRIDVVFVPYGNEARFKPGAALYSCALTVIICHKAGEVGEILPGESTSVHPFFGKPMRGFFVEAKLADEDAASEEIIHAGRPPFFF